MLEPDAEERLARERRQREEREREPERPFDPEVAARVDRLSDAIRERNLQLMMRDWDREDDNLRGVAGAWLCLVAGDELAGFRADLARAYSEVAVLAAAVISDDQRHEMKERARALFAPIREAVLAAAVRTVALDRAGEFWALDALGRLLGEIRPELLSGTGTYTPAQVAVLATALAVWTDKHGGEDAAIAAVGDKANIAKRHVTRAYRSLEKILAAASRGDLGLVWLIDESCRTYPGLPGTAT